jgi:CRISPR-associated exonuclease Cas4
MSSVTPTLIWYYYVCKREVWLMSHELNPTQDNSLVELGRILHEFSYKRDKKEISLGGMKMDLVRSEHGNIVIGEVKKSSRFELPARMQLCYYLYQLRKMGIEAKGELLMPKEKKRIRVELNEEVEKEIEKVVKEIGAIINMEKPPLPQKVRFCRRCAYSEFCWA